MSKLALGIELLDRLEHAVGAARVIGPRHQGLTAGEQDRVAHRLGVGGNHHRPAIGLDRAAPDMHDHRLAGDIGERLVGEPGRFQSCRDDDKAVGHSQVR